MSLEGWKFNIQEALEGLLLVIMMMMMRNKKLLKIQIVYIQVYGIGIEELVLVGPRQNSSWFTRCLKFNIFALENDIKASRTPVSNW